MICPNTTRSSSGPYVQEVAARTAHEIAVLLDSLTLNNKTDTTLFTTTPLRWTALYYTMIEREEEEGL